MSGKIYKGSIAEITVPMFPRCYTGDTANLVVDFYVTGETSIEYSVSAGTIVLDEYNNGTVVFQVPQLAVLPDGLLKYTTTCDDYLKEWETRYFITTPQDYTPIVYITNENVEEIVETEMADYVTKTEAEETYAKKSDIPSVSAFTTSADVQTMITAATTGFTTTGQVETMITAATTGFTTSGQVDTMISSATTDMATTGQVQSMISAATTGYTTTGQVQSMITSATTGFATTGQVLSMITSATTDYTTQQYVDNAVSAATQNMVTSSTINTIWYGTEAQYNNILVKDNTTLYIIE